MLIKVLEIRDRATCFSAMAIKMVRAAYHATNRVDGVNWANVQAAHLSRSGYGFEYPSIMFCNMNGGKISYDPYSWVDRTYHAAHKYVRDNFDTLKEGDVVDVEFILGETTQPKERDIV